MSNRAHHLKILFAVHVVLALIPPASTLLGIEKAPEPLVMGVMSIVLGQLMLLGIYISLFPGQLAGKIALACGIVGVQAVFNARMVPLTHEATFTPFVQKFSQYFCIWMILLVAMTMAGFAASRFLGQIRFRSDQGELEAFSTKTQFSLFSILATITGVGVILGFLREALGFDQIQILILDVGMMLILGIALCISMLLAVWTAFGGGRVEYRGVVPILAAATLGLVIEIIKLGDYSRFSPWTWTPILTVGPTAIVLLTLLPIRRWGFALVQPLNERNGD